MTTNKQAAAKTTTTTEESEAPALFNIEDIFVDVAAIEEGRWVSLGAEFSGAEILIRGLSSNPAKRLQQKLERTAERKDRLANGTLTPDAYDRVLTTVVVEKCVMDWRGIGSKGEPMAFDMETLRVFMTTPKMRRFKSAVINAITDLETKKEVAEGETAKN